MKPRLIPPILLRSALPLSAEAQESIAELTDELSATLNPNDLDPEAASIDDGAETLSRAVAPVDVRTTQDTTTGDLIHEVSTSVTALDENAIETVELIETIVIADAATGEITSLQQLATEGYIAAGEIDSSAEPHDGLEATTGKIEPAASLSAQFRSGVSSSNKTKIAQYAVKHAITPNKNYRIMTADCTNFISQTVTAGSWKKKTGWYQDNQNWWYNSLSQTWTWGGAENWYQFARNKSKRTRATTAAGLVVGDIVQVKYKGDKVINHSMVVTAKVGRTIYVSSHSRNVKNKKLSEFMKYVLRRNLLLPGAVTA